MTAVSAKTGLYSTLTFESEWMMISVLPFIWLYNGQHGKKSWITMYFFYVIYPLHFFLRHLPITFMDFNDFEIYVYKINHKNSCLNLSSYFCSLYIFLTT